MGGQSVPSATQQTVQSVTGWAAVPELKKRALGVIDPALSNIHDQQQMLLGFQAGDPNQTRKLFGLSPEASTEDITNAIGRHSQGPELLMASADTAKQGVAPEMRQLQTIANAPGAQTLGSQFGELANAPGSYKHGGIMGLHDEPARDPRKFAKGGLTADQANFLQNKLDSGKKISPAYQKKLDAYNKANPSPEKSAISDAARAAGLTPADAYLGRAGFFGASYDPATNKFSITNPYYNAATDVLQGMNTRPAQFDQATQAYTDAISGLQKAANYTPQQVEAQQIEAAKIARGDIRDVAAQQADVERYKATNIAPTARETGVTTAAPGSWTQAGTAAQYMSPYMQNVVDIQKREAQRDFGKQMAMLNAQAAGQGAYGGSRQAIERSEARRNQAQRLADIEAQGLQQSYSQGMGQFQQEQQLGSQVGMANTAQINQLKSQYMQMGLTEAQANQAAQNAASQFGAAAQNQAYNNYVQQQLQAQLQNQGMDYNTAQQNAAMLMQQRTANQNAALQAAMANQSAGLQANQQALGAYGAIGNMGQGLGSLGTQIGGYNANLANLWGQAGGVYQGLGTNYFNQIRDNAANIFGGPTTLAGQGTGLLSGAGGTTGTRTGTTTPGSAFG